jgi:Fic family protein
MKPPCEITPKILKLISSISEKIGEVNANYLTKQSPQLRKKNRIKTIHSSLKIEGNTLTEEQITALIENLENLLCYNNRTLKDIDRLEYWNS